MKIIKATREMLIGYDVDWIISKESKLIGVIGRGKNTKKYPYNKVFEIKNERRKKNNEHKN